MIPLGDMLQITSQQFSGFGLVLKVTHSAILSVGWDSLAFPPRLGRALLRKESSFQFHKCDCPDRLSDGMSPGLSL